MSTIIDEPAHWRSRAEKARTNADQMKSPESRRTMLEIATRYDRLAELAERRKQP
jgi:hypothetical protein